jgi:hypothetical protein
MVGRTHRFDSFKERTKCGMQLTRIGSSCAKWIMLLGQGRITALAFLELWRRCVTKPLPLKLSTSSSTCSQSGQDGSPEILSRLRNTGAYLRSQCTQSEQDLCVLVNETERNRRWTTKPPRHGCVHLTDLRQSDTEGEIHYWRNVGWLAKKSPLVVC